MSKNEFQRLAAITKPICPEPDPQKERLERLRGQSQLLQMGWPDNKKDVITRIFLLGALFIRSRLLTLEPKEGTKRKPKQETEDDRIVESFFIKEVIIEEDATMQIFGHYI